MNIQLRPVDDSNREAVLALSVREDQPFVAPNDVSLQQAAETNEKYPGVARPFGIYADEKLVGFGQLHTAEGGLTLAVGANRIYAEILSEVNIQQLTFQIEQTAPFNPS